MKTLHLLLVLNFLFSNYSASSDRLPISICSTTMEGIYKLTGGLEFPTAFQNENPLKTGNEFDVMKYFEILDHLSMRPGYILDYVYHFDGMGGYPILYVRPATQTPFKTETDLAASGEGLNYLDFIQTDDSPESYFQFVVLAVMGRQFYLFWHANYSVTQIPCNLTDVSSIIASLNGDFGRRISFFSWVRAHFLTNITPSTRFDPQTVEVRFVRFTRWGGFYQEIYTINRSMPHTIVDRQEKNLIPYYCGVMF
jgi:hypothetical protein